MHKFIKIRHDIIKQCYVNYKEMKKFNYKLEIEIFRNSTLKNVGVLRGAFKGLGCPKGTQTPCWLRPCRSVKKFGGGGVIFLSKMCVLCMFYVNWELGGRKKL